MTDTPDGELSEVTNLDADRADTPISDADHVAGYPDSESGRPDEGSETGPDAHTASEHGEPVRDEEDPRESHEADSATISGSPPASA